MATRRTTPLSVETTDPHSCTVDVRHHVLAHVPFFAGLDPDELADIDRMCRVSDVDRGDAIHHAGQPASRIHVVATGTGKLVRPTLEGTEVLLDVLRPGDLVGTLPTLGVAHYVDSAWALTPMCLLGLDADAFDEILDRYPGVARAGLGVVARRLAQAQAQVHAMAAATAEQRIAAALLMLAERAGVRRGGRLLIDLPLSRDDLGRLTGSASETVSRVLAALARDGVVETGRQWVAISDLDALAGLAEI